MNRRLERVNVASLRVALISTGLVAAVYALVAMLVVVFVTNNLTAQAVSRALTPVARSCDHGGLRRTYQVFTLLPAFGDPRFDPGTRERLAG